MGEYRVETYSSRIDKRMQVGLLEQVDVGLLRGLGVLLWRANITKDGRIDSTVEANKLRLIGRTASLRADPVIPNGLVRVEL